MQVLHQYFDSLGRNIGEDFKTASQLMPQFSSTLSIVSLHSNDSGSHTCVSILHPLESVFVESFDTQSASINIEIGMWSIQIFIVLL